MTADAPPAPQPPDLFLYREKDVRQIREFLTAVIADEHKQLKWNLSQPRTPHLDFGAVARRQRIDAYQATLRALPDMPKRT